MFQDPELKGLKSFGVLCFRIVNKVIREEGFDINQFTNIVKGEGSLSSEYNDDYLAVAGLKTSDLLVEDKAINHVLKALEIFNNNHITDHNQTPDQLIPLVQHVFSTLQYNVQGVRLVSIASEGGSVCTRFVEEKIGAGLYPTLALLNHSCNANTRIRFEGGKIVVYSTQCITANSEVTHNYGPTVEQMARDQRRASLHQVYGFVCDCVSCSAEAAEAPHAMACSKCAGPVSYTFPTCETCGARTNPEVIIRNEQELIDQLTMIEFDWCDESVEYLISHAERVLYCESTFLGKVYDKMAKHYCEDSVWSKAEEFTAKSCGIIKAVYGPNSVTYAIELFKLCQVHFNLLKAVNGIISEFEGRVKECCLLFSESSGVREEVMRELEGMLEWIRNERCFNVEFTV